MQTSIVECHLRFQDNIKLSYFLKGFRQRDLNILWAYYKTCVQFWREFFWPQTTAGYTDARIIGRAYLTSVPELTTFDHSTVTTHRSVTSTVTSHRNTITMRTSSLPL